MIPDLQEVAYVQGRSEGTSFEQVGLCWITLCLLPVVVDCLRCRYGGAVLLLQ